MNDDTLVPRAPAAGSTPPPPTPDADASASTPSASTATLLAALAAAVFGDVAVHGDVASIAGLATVVAAVGVLATADRNGSWRDRAHAVAGGTASLFLAGNLVLRSSVWIIGPTVLAIVACLVVAAHGRRTHLTLRSSVDAALAAAAAGLRSVPFLSAPVRAWLRTGGGDKAAIARGIVVVGVVVSSLSLLLANGDAVFGSLLSGWTLGPAWSHAIVIALLVPLAASLAVPRHGPFFDVESPLPPRPIEALMGLAAVTVVLGVWSITQLVVALGGADRLLATESLTRAEYAREGFFELVVVVGCVLTFLATFRSLAGDGRRRWTSVLTSVTTALTLLLVGVTFSRLLLYIDAFGLTMLRLSVAWFLGWMASVIVAVGVSIVRPVRLGTVAFAGAAVVTVLFGWSDPEARVVETNIGRAERGIELDVDYLTELDVDAIPTLRRLAPALADEVCADADLGEGDGPFGWNLARSRARSDC